MQNALNPHCTLRRAEDLLETEVDGEVVLMSLDIGNCYGLDRTGSSIWRALRTPTTLAKLQDACSARYDGDPAVIHADVADLVSTLIAEHLVQAEPALP